MLLYMCVRFILSESLNSFTVFLIVYEFMLLVSWGKIFDIHSMSVHDISSENILIALFQLLCLVSETSIPMAMK